MMFSKPTPAVLAIVFFGLMLGGPAFACSLDGWDSNTGVQVGSPYDATPPDVNGIQRFENLCAMRANATGHAQVHTSLSHSAVWNRFYALLNASNFTGSGDAKILAGYSDDGATTELYNISYNGTHLNFNTPGNDASVAVGPGWHVIEYNVDYSADKMDIWVDTDAVANSESPDATINGLTGVRGPVPVIEAIRLGLPDGLGGFDTGAVNFDTFALTSTMPSGPILNCDADNNTGLNFNDLSTMYFELFPPNNLSTGTPDCDANGGVNFNDLSALYFILFPP